MTETVEVEMTASQRIDLSLTCEIDKADWDEYNRILNDPDMRYAEKDKKINEIAEKYGLDRTAANQIGWDDMEETQIALVTESET